MPYKSHKLSDAMKQMSERLLRERARPPSSEAAHVALFFANVAWNESVGLVQEREHYRSVWEEIEGFNPALWNELKTNDVDAMIDELVEFKKRYFPDDRRRILLCGIPAGKIRVEWLPPATPGVDSNWEMQLYGLVRTNQKERAISFLQETRGMSRAVAIQDVQRVASDLKLR